MEGGVIKVRSFFDEDMVESFEQKDLVVITNE